MRDGAAAQAVTAPDTPGKKRLMSFNGFFSQF